MAAARPTVFIVDDDSSVLRSLARLARQAGYEPRTFPSAEQFLASQTAPLTQPACLVLDLTMPGLTGLELQQRLSPSPTACPIIFISGNGTIPATVEAMRRGAVTFLSKPFDDVDLLQAIAEAVAKHRQVLADGAQVQAIRDRINLLTEREHAVMAWVITGALNKQIADRLGIVEKTVKVHRARVMDKMRVTSVAELVRLCAAAGFAAAQP
ncbi:MAG: response regulator [Verrucomicrobia bacterium]|nr:response regulator [Verrucomicrobiota bacterium]